MKTPTGDLPIVQRALINSRIAKFKANSDEQAYFSIDQDFQRMAEENPELIEFMEKGSKILAVHLGDPEYWYRILVMAVEMYSVLAQQGECDKLLQSAETER